jgi:hypothetical protein
MPRPSLATETPEERKARDDRYKERALRCPDCPIGEDGYPPEVQHKFSFGGDFENRFSTEIYQCPVCKELVVQER